MTQDHLGDEESETQRKLTGLRSTRYQGAEPGVDAGFPDPKNSLWVQGHMFQKLFLASPGLYVSVHMYTHAYMLTAPSNYPSWHLHALSLPIYG